VTYAHPQKGNIQVTGYRTWNGLVNGKPAPVKVEWTYQMALAHEALGNRAEADRIIAEMEKVRNADGSMPSALEAGWTYPGGWVLTTFPETTAVFTGVDAKTGYQPFDLGGGSTYRSGAIPVAAITAPAAPVPSISPVLPGVQLTPEMYAHPEKYKEIHKDAAGNPMRSKDPEGNVHVGYVNLVNGIVTEETQQNTGLSKEDILKNKGLRVRITYDDAAGIIVRDTVYFSPEGERHPMYRVSHDNTVDEVYEDIPVTDPGQVGIRVYHLAKPIPYISGQDPNAAHQQLLKQVQDAKLPYKERVYDALDRLIITRGGGYVTYHDYVGQSTVENHSRMYWVDPAGNERFYHQVYQAGISTYGDIIQGLKASNLDETIPDAVTRAHVVDLLRTTGILQQGQFGTFDRLPQKVKDVLIAQGIDATTPVQMAVVVRAWGEVALEVRRPNDAREQVLIVIHGPHRTLSVDWKDSDTTRSFKLAPDNQVLAEYQSTGAVPAKDVLPPDVLKEVAVMGILPDSLLPVVDELTNSIEGNVTPTHVDANGHQDAYSANLRWTDGHVIRTRMYLVPGHPLGIDIARHAEADGWAINMWWLMGTNKTQAPLGILPGSIFLNQHRQNNGLKVYESKGQMTVRGMDGSRRTYDVFNYRIRDAGEKRGEAYTSNGQLIARIYDWVRVRAANLVPVTKGVETVYYDPAVPLEIATYAEGNVDGEAPMRTKTLLSDAFEVEKGKFAETQRWLELDPLLLYGEKTWIRAFVNGIEQMPKHDLLRDTLDEARQYHVAKWGSIGFGIAVFIVFIFWLFGKIGLRRDLSRTRRGAPSSGPAPSAPEPGVPPDSGSPSSPAGMSPISGGPRGPGSDSPVGSPLTGDALRQRVNEILESFGVKNPGDYAVAMRIESESREPAWMGHYDDMFMDALNQWRDKTRDKTGETDADIIDRLTRCVLIEWLTEEMNRGGASVPGKNSMGGIADLPTFIFYLLNQTMMLYADPAQAGNIAVTVHKQVDALRLFLMAQEARQGLRSSRVSYDDMIDNFENKTFLRAYKSASLDQLQGFYAGVGLGSKYPDIAPPGKVWDEPKAVDAYRLTEAKLGDPATLEQRLKQHLLAMNFSDPVAAEIAAQAVQDIRQHGLDLWNQAFSNYRAWAKSVNLAYVAGLIDSDDKPIDREVLVAIYAAAVRQLDMMLTDRNINLTADQKSPFLGHLFYTSLKTFIDSEKRKTIAECLNTEVQALDVKAFESSFRDSSFVQMLHNDAKPTSKARDAFYKGARIGMPINGKEDFDDKVGYKYIFRNLWPVIVFIFAPAVWVLIDSLLSRLGLPASGWARILSDVINGLALTATAAYLGRTTPRIFKDVKAARSQILGFIFYYVLTIGAVFLPMTWYLDFHLWAAVLAYMHLGVVWTVYLAGPIIYIGAAFTGLSLFILPTVTGLLFVMYRQARSGFGQVVTLKQAKRRFADARRHFNEVMIPPATRAAWVRVGRDPEQEVWKRFWKILVEQNLNSKERSDLLLSEDELDVLRNADSLDALKSIENPEALWRICRTIDSFLMWMPNALSSAERPKLTMMITAFAEKVEWRFADLNSLEPGGTARRVNQVIAAYPQHWITFDHALGKEVEEQVRRGLLSPDEAARIRSVMGNHMRDITSGNLLARLPDDLPEFVKTGIETWVGTRMTPMSKTVREVSLIREAFIFHEWINHPEFDPDTTEGRQALEQIVDQNVQILVNYEAFGTPMAEKAQEKELELLFPKYPWMEVWWRGTGLKKWDPINKRIMDVEKQPYGGPIARGKPFGQNAILPFVRNRKFMMFDVNAAVRWEEAIKVPMGLAEFKLDPTIGMVLFGENIYNAPYNWITKSFAEGEEEFSQDEQDFLAMFGAEGFYGHSGITDRNAFIISGGAPHKYSGEDTIFAIKLWRMGLRIEHRLYAIFGKSREAGFIPSLIPLGRWSQNVAEYFVTRWLPRLVRDGKIHIGQLIIAFKSYSFFPKKELIPMLNDFYMGWVVLLGISGAVDLKFILITGAFGLFMNQAGAIPALFKDMRKQGAVAGLWDFIATFPQKYSTFTPVIPTYGTRFHNAGAYGQGGFATSGKGYSLNHYPMEEIWAREEILGPKGKPLGRTNLIGVPRAWRLQVLIGAMAAFAGIYFSVTGGPAWLSMAAFAAITWILQVLIRVVMRRTPRLLIYQFVLSMAMAALSLWLPGSWKMIGLFGITVGLTAFWKYFMVPLNRNVRQDLWPQNPEKRSALKMQMIMAVKQIVMIGLALWLWGAIPIAWYYWAVLIAATAAYYTGSLMRTSYVGNTLKNSLIIGGLTFSIGTALLGAYIATPMFLLIGFSIFYLGIAFTNLLVPLLAHARPFLPLEIVLLKGRAARASMNGYWNKFRNLFKSNLKNEPFFSGAEFRTFDDKATKFITRMTQPVEQDSEAWTDGEPMTEVVLGTILGSAKSYREDVNPAQFLAAIDRDDVLTLQKLADLFPDLEKQARPKDLAFSDFVPTELDVNGFRTALKNQDDVSTILRSKIEPDVNVDNISADQLAKALNALLLMPGFNSHIDALRLALSPPIAELLILARAGNNLLPEDLKKLNKAILMAVYPSELRNTGAIPERTALLAWNLYVRLHAEPGLTHVQISQRAFQIGREEIALEHFWAELSGLERAKNETKVAEEVAKQLKDIMKKDPRSASWDASEIARRSADIEKSVRNKMAIELYWKGRNLSPADEAAAHTTVAETVAKRLAQELGKVLVPVNQAVYLFPDFVRAARGALAPEANEGDVVTKAISLVSDALEQLNGTPDLTIKEVANLYPGLLQDVKNRMGQPRFAGTLPAEMRAAAELEAAQRTVLIAYDQLAGMRRKLPAINQLKMTISYILNTVKAEDRKAALVQALDQTLTNLPDRYWPQASRKPRSINVPPVPQPLSSLHSLFTGLGILTAALLLMANTGRMMMLADHMSVAGLLVMIVSFLVGLVLIVPALMLIRQSYRIRWAKRMGAKDPNNTQWPLLPALRSPAAIEMNGYAGPEDIEPYRHQIAFILNQKLFVDKSALRFLSYQEQRSIVRHELAHYEGKGEFGAYIAQARQIAFEHALGIVAPYYVGSTIQLTSKILNAAVIAFTGVPLLLLWWWTFRRAFVDPDFRPLAKPDHPSWGVATFMMLVFYFPYTIPLAYLIPSAFRKFGKDGERMAIWEHLIAEGHPLSVDPRLGLDQKLKNPVPALNRSMNSDA